MRRAFIGIVFSVLFILFIVFQVNPEQLAKAVQGANPFFLAPFLVCVALFFWLKTERWKLLLQPLRRCSLKELFPPTIIGVSMNYLLFAYVGELFRTYLFHKRTKLPKTSIFGSIVFERTLDVIIVLLLAGIGFSLSSPLPSTFVAAGYFLSGIAVLAIACVVCLVFWTDACIKVLRSLLRLAPIHLQESAIKHLEQGIRGLHSLAHPKLMVRIVFLSATQWIFMSLCAYFAMLSVGIEAPLYASFIVIAAVSFGVILPSSPAHIGVLEFCFMISLRIYGVPDEQAVAAALLYHFVLYFVVITIGILSLKSAGISFAKAKERAEKYSEDAPGGSS